MIEYNRYESSNHKPLVQFVMDKLKPNFVMELGMGFYSTSLFNSYKLDKFISIENDIEWISTIVKSYYSENHSVIYHQINIDKFTKWSDLFTEEKQGLVDYYQQIKKTIPTDGLKLLFVDNYTSCRMVAMNILVGVFDIIIFHDCQPEGVLMYEYDFSNTVWEKWNRCTLTSPNAYTGLLTRKEIPFDFIGIQKYINAFNKEMGVDYKMEVKYE